MSAQRAPRRHFYQERIDIYIVAECLLYDPNYLSDAQFRCGWRQQARRIRCTVWTRPVYLLLLYLRVWKLT